MGVALAALPCVDRGAGEGDVLVIITRLNEGERRALDSEGDHVVRLRGGDDELPRAPVVVVDMAGTPAGKEEAVARRAQGAGRVVIRGRTSAESKWPDGRASLIGEGEAMQRVRSLVKMVGPTESSVYLSGETGTGKELVARLIHDTGPRRKGRLVCINCAAIPDSLLESELFGHERGAFTGATSAHSGAFEAADGGTLFLDEIGDMSPYAQAKVLRALEDRSVRKVGGTTEKRVDIRIIAASNQDLEERVEAGQFRSDLYFRLNVVRIELPNLRQRLEDVPLLARHFLAQLNERHGRAVTGFEPEAMAALLRYEWPGNVRELRNVVEGTVVTLRGDRIGFADLPARLVARLWEANDSEKQRLLAALVETKWNKTRAARKLSWSRMTVYRKMTHYRISEPAAAGPGLTKERARPSGVRPIEADPDAIDGTGGG